MLLVVRVPAWAVMVEYIDQYRHVHGVEPICGALKDTSAAITPSTYYAAKARVPFARAVRDAVTVAKITKVHQDNLRGVRGREGPRPAAQGWATGGQVHRGTPHAGQWDPWDQPGQEPAHHDPCTWRAAPPGPGGAGVHRAGTKLLWVADIERHEALLNRAVMKGHRLRLVTASRKKLRAA